MPPLFLRLCLHARPGEQTLSVLHEIASGSTALVMALAPAPQRRDSSGSRYFSRAIESTAAGRGTD
jgi:hypothetical protein